MKPRIRTAPSSSHRRARALAAGVAVFALPAAANAAVTPADPGTTLTLTGDATSRQHHARRRRRRQHHAQPPARPAASPTPRTSIPAPASRRCRPTARSPSTLNAGDGNDNVNFSAAELRRQPDDQRRGRRRHHRRLGAPSTRSTAATATTASRPSAATRRSTAATATTSSSGTTATATTSTTAAPALDETLITEGNADDQMTRHAERRGVRFDAHQRAVHGRLRTTIEKLTITSFSGNDMLTTGAGRRAADDHRRRPRQRHDHHRRRRRPDQRRRRQRHAQRRAGGDRIVGDRGATR